MRIIRSIGYMVSKTLVMWESDLANGAWTKPKIRIMRGERPEIIVTTKSKEYQDIVNLKADKPSIMAVRNIIQLMKDNEKDPNQTVLL